jgi:hypothetical protein
MNLDSNDKTNIIFISITFLVVVIASFYVANIRNTNYIDYGQFKDEEMINEINNNLQKTNNKTCSFCEDQDINRYLSDKFKEAGLEDYYTPVEIEQPDSLSLSNMPNMDTIIVDNCTSLFSFLGSYNYNKNYKYSLPRNYTFFSSEKYKGTLNSLYIINTFSKISFNSNVYSSEINSYYDGEGNCVYSEYKTDNSDTFSKIPCSSNYNPYLCEEIINELEYKGEEKYYVYGNNYDVFVYSNTDNSTIIKYGKDVPVLFYMKKYDNANKFFIIELTSLEGLK